MLSRLPLVPRSSTRSWGVCVYLLCRRQMGAHATNYYSEKTARYSTEKKGEEGVSCRFVYICFATILMTYMFLSILAIL